MITILRALLVGMGAVVIAMTVWIVTPSSMFLSPISIRLDGEQLTFVRDTPFGEVDLKWVGEVTMLDQDHYECGGSGRRIAQVEPGNVMTTRIGIWARPCIAEGGPFILRYQYQVMLWGIIPLRPAGISVQVDKDGRAS